MKRSVFDTEEPTTAAWCWGSIAATGAVAALVLILITTGASHLYYPLWVVFVVFGLAFPVLFGTELAVIRRTRAIADEPGLLRLRPLPVRRSVALFVVVAYAAAAVLSLWSVPTLFRGNAEKHDGRYYQNNHGQLTEVSESTYHAAEIGEARWFLSVGALFLGAGAVVNLRVAKRVV